MLSHIEEEYEAFNKNRSWKQVFDRIQNEATMLHNLSVKFARLPENRERNRYRDVSPYDDHRVLLKEMENNYINASYVDVPLAKRRYILTQGPLGSTAGHFWLMVWQQNSKAVVMLNKIVEDGRLKCHPYFPMGAEVGGEDTLTFEDVNIKVEHLGQKETDYYIIRNLKMTLLETGEEKTILQFHYVDWPDFGIPQNSDSFLEFLYSVRQSGAFPAPGDTEKGPPVIHCSAGIGRSGTICLVDSALVLVERTKSLATLDIRNMLIDMRQYRCGLIQRPEQLRFSYMAILDGARAILTPPEPLEGAPDIPDSLPESPEDSEDSSNISDEEVSARENFNSNNTAGDVDQEEVSNHKNSLDVGPDPPPRTTSLTSEEGADTFPHQQLPTEDDEQPPIKIAHTEAESAPNPPQRTSSLRKGVSMDEYPPPVPPRPPNNSVKRQISAPSSPESKTKEQKFDDDIDEGYENTSNSPIKKKREEQKRKTQAMIDAMREKQKKAEAAYRNTGLWSTSSLLLGAGLAVALAAGVMYFRGYAM